MRKYLYILTLLLLTSCSMEKYFYSETDYMAYSYEHELYLFGKNKDGIDGKIIFKKDKILIKNNDYLLTFIPHDTIQDNENYYEVEGLTYTGETAKLKIFKKLDIAFLYLIYDPKKEVYKGYIHFKDLKHEK